MDDIEFIEFAISRRQLNLDVTYKCPLACSKCKRITYKKNKIPIGGHDLSIKDFEKLIKFYNYINFCGQVSDPTAHPKFKDMLEILYERKIGCRIHTAASHKSFDWYKEAFNVNMNASWEFGLDGLPEESHKYRVNQDGEKLWEIMKWGAKNGNIIDWQWIFFKYNENNWEKGQRLAKKHGINLINMHSNRFDNNDPLEPTKMFKQTYLAYLARQMEKMERLRAELDNASALLNA